MVVICHERFFQKLVTKKKIFFFVTPFLSKKRGSQKSMSERCEIGSEMLFVEVIHKEFDLRCEIHMFHAFGGCRSADRCVKPHVSKRHHYSHSRGSQDQSKMLFPCKKKFFLIKWSRFLLWPKTGHKKAKKGQKRAFFGLFGPRFWP